MSSSTGILSSTSEEQHTSSFKEQLDQKAKDDRHPPSTETEPGTAQILKEKVNHYVPAAAKILGTDAEQKEDERTTPPKETHSFPARPSHDANIEDFIRDQHKSKKGADGQLAEV
ncbi:uncharacterized protein BCR38DRAFT_480400 [Pseudomassariella vexata]|uniref:Uncharacterized protein n=1 Tax=Pseudomassariella vexata TaxID=1141098 RepID=A0A1Y2EKT9_9PEZI|nr:uncharacterized protein BCR38DRAFT_480400 [Pseudomassariella vexata]ORY71924.1 hypothetical protein BCR38DRAFT_480400 [Pseudomassariella vexata]